MGLPAFQSANQIEETRDQAPRLREASVDRTHVLSLHKSMGNWKGQITVQRDKNYDMMRDFSERVKRNGCDWMRGQDVPNNWESRHNIPMNSWHEKWLNYQRDFDIQQDMDWLSKAVFHFYQIHLDRMVRKNELLWGDFCRPKYHWNEVTEKYEKYLGLNTHTHTVTTSQIQQLRYQQPQRR